MVRLVLRGLLYEGSCSLCRVLMLVPLMCTIRQRLRAQR